MDMTDIVASRASGQRELATLISRFAPADGSHSTAVPGLMLHRHTRPVDLGCGVSRAALVIAAQPKRVIVAGQAYEYDAQNCLITHRLADPVARDVRVTGRAAPVPVADARSAAHRRLRGRDAAARTRCVPEGEDRARRADAAAARCRAAADAAARYAGRHCGRRAADRKGTAVPADDERAGHAAAAHGDRGQPDAPDRPRDRMDPRSLRGADARRVARAGGQHERVVAAPSFQARDDAGSLQYQKQLRLHEARRLLLRQGGDVGSVAAVVGYESASQFSREYSRLFGAPPMRDVVQLRRKELLG